MLVLGWGEAETLLPRARRARKRQVSVYNQEIDKIKKLSRKVLVTAIREKFRNFQGLDEPASNRNRRFDGGMRIVTDQLDILVLEFKQVGDTRIQL